MQQEKQRSKFRGRTGRAVTLLAVAAGVMAAGSAIAAGPAPVEPDDTATAAPTTGASAVSAPASAAPSASVRTSASHAATVHTSGAPASAMPAASATTPAPVKKSSFFETYHGHQIMGWGRGDAACAYIDGTRLVVYSAPGGMYTSAVQGFKPASGLKAITKASVRALGDLDLAADTTPGTADAAEPKSQCPDFQVTVPEPTKTPTKAPTKAPTMAPTKAATTAPTKAATKAPTTAPTMVPTTAPTMVPTK